MPFSISEARVMVMELCFFSAVRASLAVLDPASSRVTSFSGAVPRLRIRIPGGSRGIRRRR